MNRMSIVARIPIYPWLAAVFPILSLSTSNVGQIETLWVLWAIPIAIGVTTASIVVYRFLLGSWHKASLAGLATVVAFYAYGPASALVESYLMGKSGVVDTDDAVTLALQLPMVLSSIWLLLLVACIVLIAKVWRYPSYQLCRPLNVIAAILVAIPLVQVVLADRSGAVASQRRPDFSQAVNIQPLEPPDIYHIVLDGYAREDVLSEYYGFDNSSFLGELRRAGFSTVRGGNSNYYWTFLSLASTLNMDYLTSVLDGPILPGSVDRHPSYQAIRNNSVATFLGEIGYEYIHLQSTWGATRVNPHADTFLSCSTSLFTNEYFRAIAEASWLRALSARASANLASCHATNFETLATLPSSSKPKFVFSHFVMPHHPYLFDREGRILHDATIANQFDFRSQLWEDKSGYIDQLMHVNRMVVEAVSQILKNSIRPPIILIHSDHGPNLKRDLGEDERRSIRFANFAAIYAPGVEHDLIPDGETPVNYFRRILNEYFDTELPILESRLYFSEYLRPFNFEEVNF